MERKGTKGREWKNRVQNKKIFFCCLGNGLDFVFHYGFSFVFHYGFSFVSLGSSRIFMGFSYVTSGFFSLQVLFLYGFLYFTGFFSLGFFYGIFF